MSEEKNITIKSDSVEIPKDIIESCREIAKAVAECGLQKFEGKLMPGFHSKWWHEVHFTWVAGRHNADSNRIHIYSTASVHTEIEEKQ
jgi:hypothetical protein